MFDDVKSLVKRGSWRAIAAVAAITWGTAQASKLAQDSLAVVDAHDAELGELGERLQLAREDLAGFEAQARQAFMAELRGGELDAAVRARAAAIEKPGRPPAPWGPDDEDRMGRQAYEAYADNVGGQSYNGQVLQEWPDLGERQRHGWAAAAWAIASS